MYTNQFFFYRSTIFRIESDIVCVTDDGTSVMTTFGNLLEEQFGVPYLLCANHTISLAVTDSLFIVGEGILKFLAEEVARSKLDIVCAV